MLDTLKKEVCAANKALQDYRLVIFTEGNVSAISDDRKFIAIKPSGISYDSLTPEDIVVTDRKGNTVEGNLEPSTDLKTHLEIYSQFPKIACVVHTHSPYATIFAQRREPIMCFGTTQADSFFGDIPVTRELREKEINDDYECSTGKAICEVLTMNIPAVLVANHGPFVVGTSISGAINNAVVLEKVAFMAIHGGKKIPFPLLNKHYLRKHGSERYYGQKKIDQREPASKKRKAA
jgi:L-ribulose-5-phosphate 4-epimerase